MAKQDTLRPVDLAVAMALATIHGGPSPTFAELASKLGVSSSTAHAAVRRLQDTGLLRAGTHEPNARELRNFLAHGAKHAFPPRLGRDVRGIPTAHAGPTLKELFEGEKPVVWPDPKGSTRGIGLAPLYPQAVGLPQRAPEVYRALSLVDAIRIGQARERNAALRALDGILGTKSE